MKIEQLAAQAAKSTHAPTSILHPAFVYVPASRTDVAETFRRIREQQAQAKPANVKQIAEKAARSRSGRSNAR
jgi:nucleoside-diphosphate-sugar epimerase